MSVEHINWRYVGSVGFGSGSTATCAQLLDAIFDLATRTTYNDGTIRTAGSASAGTWTKVTRGQTECLYCATPTNTLNQRIMIAGTDSTPSITMQGGESYTTNTMMVNLVKNAGAGTPTGTTWNSVDPFAGGQVFGWGKWWLTANGSGVVYLWEAKDAIAVVATNATSTTTYGFIAGAILDSESTDTVVDSESDGKLYGVIRSGRSRTISHTFWTDGYNPTCNNVNGCNRFLSSNWNGVSTTYDENACAAVFAPNTSTVMLLNTTFQFAVTPTATTLKTRSGQFARVPILYRSLSSDNIIGRLRDIYAFSDAQLGQRLTSGTTVIGYILCGHGAALVDAILLEHA
jgi:hypothetical protein